MIPGTLQPLAQLLVDYSLAVHPGQEVGLLGAPGTRPLLGVLQEEVTRAGGRAHLLLDLAQVEPVLARLAACILVESGPGDGADERQREAQRSARHIWQQLRERLLDRQLPWTVTVFPDRALAARVGLTLTRWWRLLSAACFLDRPDPVSAWRRQAEQQQRLCDVLGRARELRFTTPAGTDLHVGVAGRTWINSDGRWNMPDGEVFSAPCEEATEGVMYVTFPVFLGSVLLDGIRLRFRGGEVVDASATVGEEWLHQLLGSDPGARRLGEIALGCNHALHRATGHPLLDEKIGGTFHLALGSAYPATGGLNRSQLHWDLVADLRAGGRVLVDGRPLPHLPPGLA